MDWSSFLGAFAGGVVGVLIILGGFIAWDELRRKSSQPEPSPKPLSLDDILESHLEQFIVQNFDALFPGWRIHTLNLNTTNSNSKRNQRGIRYRTDAGEIDILCLDQEDHFVVVELKRNKAPDTVVAQTDRYIGWVEQSLAQPGQQVRGLIVAKSLDKHLAYILSQRQNVNLWAYTWQMQFDKNIVQTALEEPS